MRKILAYLWLPLVSFALLTLIYGSLTILDLKNQNQNLDQKQKRLEKQIVLLEDKFAHLSAAESKDQSPKATQKIAGFSTKAIPTPSTTLGASPTSTPTPTVAPTPTPTSTSTLMPTPIPTPTPSPSPVAQTTVTIENIGTYSIILQTDDTAFSILLRAGQENSFSVEYQIYEGLGAFVNCIAGICAHDNYYWAFYYNGSYSMVGASLQEVLDGDTTAWKFESF